jgi:hypothetical protein
MTRFDIDGDNVYDTQESAAKGYEEASAKYTNDLGRNIALLISPVTFLFFESVRFILCDAEDFSCSETDSKVVNTDRSPRKLQ